MALALADEVCGDDPRFASHRDVHLGEGSADQLRGDQWPRRVDVAAVRGDAGEARGAARPDVGADLGPGPAEHDRHVRDVVRDQARAASGVQDVLRQDDDGRGIRNPLVRRVVPLGEGDFEP